MSAVPVANPLANLGGGSGKSAEGEASLPPSAAEAGDGAEKGQDSTQGGAVEGQASEGGGSFEQLELAPKGAAGLGRGSERPFSCLDCAFVRVGGFYELTCAPTHPPR